MIRFEEYIKDMKFTKIKRYIPKIIYYNLLKYKIKSMKVYKLRVWHRPNTDLERKKFHISTFEGRRTL